MRRRIAMATIVVMLVAMMVPTGSFAAGTWTEQTHDVAQYLQDVFFIDANTGWATGGGGTMVKTTDGGTTWAHQTLPVSEQMNTLFFVDANTGWAVGNNATILKTTDGGANWTQQTAPDIPSGDNIFDLYFEDANLGFIVTRNIMGDVGMICGTGNGGADWVLLSTEAAGLHGIDFADANHAWVVGKGGTILKNEVGDFLTWTPQTSGTTQDLYSVSFANSAVGWACGANQTVLRTEDGGVTWTPQTATPDLYHLMDIQAVDANTAFAVGSDGIMSTTDGGATWVEEVPDHPNYPDTYRWFNGVFFLDASTGWAVGYQNTEMSAPPEPDDGGKIFKYESTPVGGDTGDVSVSASAPAPTELSLTFSVTAGTAPAGGSVSDTGVDFGTLEANTAKQASQQLQVTTNASNGYQVTASEDGPLASGTYTIPDVVGDAGTITEAIAGTWTNADTYGFGYSLADVSGSAAAFTSGYKQFADIGSAESAQDVMSATGPAVADAVDVLYKLNIGPAQQEGAYSNTVTFIATGNL